ncbi:Arm DNA-binding domain-containing protein [Celeribacter sp.]
MRPSGLKLWQVKYRSHRRERFLSIGQHPEVSLS